MVMGYGRGQLGSLDDGALLYLPGNNGSLLWCSRELGGSGRVYKTVAPPFSSRTGICVYVQMAWYVPGLST